MMSMLNTLVENQAGCEITFIHAVQNREVHAMREHVDNLRRNTKTLLLLYVI
ncbi:hypothetical protein GT022_15435 [Agaribacter marinus]|uniref:Uncharacterized protein n=2 Tax=Virgibacillus TaxID=84406 RepID=A0A941IDT0_9BACI|nr:hypothetical protein [Virgibacillus salarius]NAZ10142.1 hypothetical protein [Agaribacter marinus]